MANGNKIIMLGWWCGHVGQNRVFQPHNLEGQTNPLGVNKWLG